MNNTHKLYFSSRDFIFLETDIRASTLGDLIWTKPQPFHSKILSNSFSSPPDNTKRAGLTIICFPAFDFIFTACYNETKSKSYTYKLELFFTITLADDELPGITNDQFQKRDVTFHFNYRTRKQL